MGMLAVRHSSQKLYKSINAKHVNMWTKNLNKFTVSEIAPLVLSFINATMPAQASGKVFDFNATLPAMATQFLVLMVFLDKTWFGPVGKVLDERDTKIQTRLSSVKSGDDELTALAEEAEKLLKTARTGAQAKIADAKSKAAAKVAADLESEKTKLDNELAESMKELEAERAVAQQNIDKQVSELSTYIVKKVLPAGFSL